MLPSLKFSKWYGLRKISHWELKKIMTMSAMVPDVYTGNI